MNDPTTNRARPDLAKLLQSAGPRPEVPVEDLRRIRAFARDEWEALVEMRKPIRRTLSLLVPTAAAAAALLVLWIWTSREGAAPSPTVAVVELVRGAARVDPLDRLQTGVDSSLELGSELSAGVQLVTADSLDPAMNLVSVRLAGGESVRLGSGTRLTLVDHSKLELLSGQVYIDSETVSAENAIEIDTPHGTVVDVGTQFLVALTDTEHQSLTVRVRTGAVEIHGRQAAIPVAAGEELRLLDDGTLISGRCSRSGDEWTWVLAAAPAFDIEGESLATFLAWATRETGWSLRFDDPALADEAPDIRLHGTIRGLRPDQAVAAVVPSAGLIHRLEGDTLVVFRSAPRRDHG